MASQPGVRHDKITAPERLPTHHVEALAMQKAQMKARGPGSSSCGSATIIRWAATRAPTGSGLTATSWYHQATRPSRARTDRGCRNQIALWTPQLQVS